MQKTCTHTDQIKDVTPHPKGCEECEKTGDEWVKVRLCLTCGHTGCCDSSKNTHARKYFEGMGHPIIDSFEPPHEWRWCYTDKIYLS
ncbi:MAG: UBP-type zinc finger domain-containing protein [Minisyncoccia bacterium]